MNCQQRVVKTAEISELAKQVPFRLSQSTAMLSDRESAAVSAAVLQRPTAERSVDGSYTIKIGIIGMKPDLCDFEGKKSTTSAQVGVASMTLPSWSIPKS